MTPASLPATPKDPPATAPIAAPAPAPTTGFVIVFSANWTGVLDLRFSSFSLAALIFSNLSCSSFLIFSIRSCSIFLNLLWIEKITIKATIINMAGLINKKLTPKISFGNFSLNSK